jgi:intracellular septation protein
MVLVFGATTLLLHDARFIQWKFSLFFWLLGLAFLLSAFIGQQPLTQRLLQTAAPELRVRRAHWQWANAAFALFFIAAGAVNLLIAYRFSEVAWVRFKVIGLPVVSMLYVFGVMMWLSSRQLPEDTPEQISPEAAP